MKIVLFHNSDVLGGAETLIIRSANWFKKQGFIVAIASCNTSFYNNHTSDIYIIDLSNQRFQADSNHLIITFPIYLKVIDKYFELNHAKVIYWTVHYYNLMNFYPYISSLQMKNKWFNFMVDKIIFRHKYLMLKKLIKASVQKKELYFMDQGIRDYLINYYNLDPESFDYDPLLPIPILPNNLYADIKRLKGTTVNIGLIGRLDRFKIYPSNKVLADFSRLTNRHDSKNYAFIIVGKGQDKNLFVLPEQLNVSFKGEVNYQQLSSYIYENIDIVFAMGTTAIEAALCHKPVVLLDVMYQECNFDYKYKFLFESQGFSLGGLVRDSKDVSGTHTLEEIIEMIEADYETIANKCYQYTLKNHSEDEVFNKLLQNVSLC